MLYKQDTLKMSLKYLYTDSLNRLVPRTDTLNLVAKNKLKSNSEEVKEKKKKSKDKEEKSTPLLPVDVYAPGAMDVYDYITLSFSEPLKSYALDSIHLRQQVDSIWKDVSFDFERDSVDLRKYNLYADWKPGMSYEFNVDSTAFVGLYGLFTDKIKKEFKVKNLEEYGQIFFNVTNATSPAFVELVDGQDKVLRTVSVVNGKADFYFLNPGKYSARLIEDTNNNGKWDTGNYKEKKEPEMVYYYTQILELKANFDLTQDWNVLSKPLDKQKPEALKKQKPDEKKKKKNNANQRTGNNTRERNSMR